MSHTKEPWSIHLLKYSGTKKAAYSAQVRATTYNGTGWEGIIMVPARYGEHAGAPLDAKTQIDNMKRSVECVNACAGIRWPEKSVPALIAALQELLQDWPVESTYKPVVEARALLKKVLKRKKAIWNT